MISNSTKGSAAGVPLAIILAWVLKEFYKIEMPSEVAVAAGAFLSLVLGFLGDVIQHRSNKRGQEIDPDTAGA